jgi:hypothetical protein
MSNTLGSFLGVENNVTMNNNPFGGRIQTQSGYARITTTLQTVIPVLIWNEDMGASPTPSPALVVPDGGFVFQVSWGIPSYTFGPVAYTTPTNVLVGTSTDTLKIATAQQGVTTAPASCLGGALNSTNTITNGMQGLGGTNGQFAASGNLPAAGFNAPIYNSVNYYLNSGTVAGIGLFAAGSATVAQRTVNLYSTVTAGTSTGSGVSVANIPTGFGYPQFLDIPVVVKTWLPPSFDDFTFVYGGVNYPSPGTF